MFRKVEPQKLVLADEPSVCGHLYYEFKKSLLLKERNLQVYFRNYEMGIGMQDHINLKGNDRIVKSIESALLSYWNEYCREKSIVGNLLDSAKAYIKTGGDEFFADSN
jgi:hypothetical protein